MYPILKLKPGKENNVIFRHPWVFSGAFASPLDQLDNGELVHVADAAGQIIGTGTFSTHSQIAVRVFEFGKAEIDYDWIRARIIAAQEQRSLLGYDNGTDTTGYRLVFGEADCLPGLIIDRYNDVFVIQSSTAGVDRLKELVTKVLIEEFTPRAIVERSDIPVRKEEGIEETDGLLYGADVEEVEFLENGIKFVADVLAGQKTGFFLDQKDLRKAIRQMANNGRILNLFSHSGSFSIAALLGGAESIFNVDSSGQALDLCSHIAELNNLPIDRITWETADVFQWLGDIPQDPFDVVMLDPPALVKSQNDLESGRKAYHFLNRAAMRLIKPNGILITSSCSTYFREEDFLFMLRRASVQTGRQLEILHYVTQSPDHPWSVYFPESRYLKSFVCRVRG
ncbi:MAG: class I SAM-dependent rRNA methyltransferase [bacterium]|nr:class I SAM-dependent rRNA methyltransferase [bacterium]